MTDDDAMPDDVLGRIETQVAMLMRLGEATRRSTSPQAHRALDRAAYVILRRLQEAGPQNVSTLADGLNLDGSTVTRQVTALQREGLVNRAPDPHDGRGTVIAATEDGLHRVDGVRAARRELYGRILADWPTADRAHLATLLSRLNGSLHAHIQGG